jgi:uncharacterized protein YqgV (UPF0045/DUF77 family)
MGIAFQVSLYPLMQNDIHPAIDGFIANLKSQKLDVDVHETSTIGSGDVDKVFSALKEAYVKACEFGDTIMVVTVANGCPTKDELMRLNER